MGENKILGNSQIEKKIYRLAFQLYEYHLDSKNELIIAGITGNGYYLAQQIHSKLQEISGNKLLLAEIKLDKTAPKAATTSLNIPGSEIKDRAVVIVDDVLNTGRTMVYAISAFIREGCSHIQTAVLADRNHKRFPVAADYVGISLATTLQERLSFEVHNGEMNLYLK